MQSNLKDSLKKDLDGMMYAYRAETSSEYMMMDQCAKIESLTDAVEASIRSILEMRQEITVLEKAVNTAADTPRRYSPTSVGARDHLSRS